MTVQPISTAAPPLLPGGRWFNSEPLEIGDLAGRVALVNFWVHSCSNCHASLPVLRRWRDRFTPADLEIVGLHTPEFPSDRDAETLGRAIARDGVTWPVVKDNDYATWRAWEVRAWPTFFLVDRAGRVRSSHVGEISSRFPAGMAPLERAIEELIAE